MGPRTRIKIINSEISNLPIQISNIKISRSHFPPCIHYWSTQSKKIHILQRHFRFYYFLRFYVVLMYVSCTTNVLDALPSFFLNFSSLLYFNLTKYKAFCSRNLKYLMLLWLQKLDQRHWTQQQQQQNTLFFLLTWNPTRIFNMVSYYSKRDIAILLKIGSLLSSVYTLLKTKSWFIGYSLKLCRLGIQVPNSKN